MTVAAAVNAVKTIVLDWLPFWEKVQPAVFEAVQALHRKFADNPQAAIAELRTIKDHWENSDAQDLGFKSRIQAVADQQAAAAPAAEPEPAPEPAAAADEPAAAPVEPEDTEATH